MVEVEHKKVKSRELALRLYDHWVRERQERPKIEFPDPKDGIKKIGLKNYVNHYIEPRRKHLAELKKVAPSMTMADKTALLVMQEFPALEISSLLHKLTRQLAADPEAPYFSKVNQDDNCGCGCGCGCSGIPWETYVDKIQGHKMIKPFSIDPFNEVGIPARERDALLIKDFLESYETLSNDVACKVNQRYFHMGRDFS